MFLALGYLHAQFRLSQMDEERRLGEGRLAQLAGPQDLSSDEFELRWACSVPPRRSGRRCRRTAWPPAR